MRYQWIDDYLMAKPAVTKDFKAEWNWIRYFIGGKMFAAVLLDFEHQPYYINLKLEPMEGELLRQQYEDIVPGYYSNKQHGIPSSRMAPSRTNCLSKCWINPMPWCWVD